MTTKSVAERASGIFAGFTGRWNLLSRTVYMLVKVDKKTIKVPIDHRQADYIKKEYGIGSKVELQFYDGDWHVMSHIQSSCEMSIIERSSTYQLPEN